MIDSNAGIDSLTQYRPPPSSSVLAVGQRCPQLRSRKKSEVGSRGMKQPKVRCQAVLRLSLQFGHYRVNGNMQYHATNNLKAILRLDATSHLCSIRLKPIK